MLSQVCSTIFGNKRVLSQNDYEDLVRDNLMPVAPFGTNEVHIADGQTSSANQAALTVALFKYADDHKLQDASDLCVLGFENGYHGNTKATLSASDPATNT
jgi:adenosylmethionine-8-amino-7-oxononanoate aminotransferase